VRVIERRHFWTDIREIESQISTSPRGEFSRRASKRILYTLLYLLIETKLLHIENQRIKIIAMKLSSFEDQKRLFNIHFRATFYFPNISD
jgi:hypothetical protein